MSYPKLLSIISNLQQKLGQLFALRNGKQYGGIQAYLFSIALMALALWLRLAIAPVSAGLQYLTFFPAVALTAVVCGFFPAMFATVLGLLLATFVFTPPYYEITWHSLEISAWSNLVFLLDGVIVSFSIERMHRYRNKYAQELELTIEAKDSLQKLYLETQLLLRRNEMLLKNSMEGVHVMDGEGRLIEVNDAFCDMLGYRREELIGMNVRDIDVKLSQADLREGFQRVIGGSMRLETEHRRKDGSRIHVEIACCGTEFQGGVIVYAASRDISELKRREEALRVAAVSFETHEAILITDAKANILRVNRAFTDITGYEAAEVIGHNPNIMSSGRQDKAFYAQMWQQLIHTGAWAGEIWDKRKDGRIYPKWLTISAVKNERQEVINYVGIFSDITARKQVEDEMRNLAFYDALTQLPNRRLFMDRFNSTLKVSARHNDFGALLFIDLDRFKVLNDTLGHDYGDLMLIEVANRIKSCVRESDTVARLGGDEFVVLLEGISTEPHVATHTAGLVAEKVREVLAQPYQLKKHTHHSSPSIGISLYRGYEKSVEEVLQEADKAMYQAKNAGRNATRFFEPEVAA